MHNAKKKNYLFRKKVEKIAFCNFQEKDLSQNTELFRCKLKIANGENATFQWEIVLARHMILSWPLSFSFSTSAPQRQQTMPAKDRGKCFKNNVCAALFGKSGKEMVYSS